MIALLFSFGITANVPRPHLRGAASEEVVVQETSAESDVDDNVVDSVNSINTLVNNEESLSNTVNLLDSTHTAPEVTLVENAPTKTLSTVSNSGYSKSVNQPATRVVTPVQTVPVQTVSVQTVPVQTVPVQSVQTVPVQTVNVLKSQTPAQSVKTSAPSKTVVVSQVPQQQVVQTAPQQQVVYSVQQQPQQQQVKCKSLSDFCLNLDR